MQNSKDFTNEAIGDKRDIPATVGIKNGVRLVLDLHSNYESFGTVSIDYNAFHIFIGQPTEFPALEERRIMIEPGYEHDLSISSKIFSSTDIRELTPKDRHCLFQDEGNLYFYKEYTFSNCRFECRLKQAEHYLKCIPWHLPHGPNSSTCDPWKARQFVDHLHNVNSSDCGYCLPDCEVTMYSVTPTSAKFRWFQFMLQS